jgi:hypothetical protein
MSENNIGIIIIVGIIAIALFGGGMKAKNSGFLSHKTTTTTQEQKKVDIEKQIKETKIQVDDLKKQIQAEEDKKTKSKYSGIVDIQHVNKSTDANKEYISLKVNAKATSTIPITGWTLKSISSGTSYTIPKATYLIFAGSINSEDPVILTGGDVVYIITGVSPNGYSFKVNKCSGYMSQFQKYTPYLRSSCPSPKKEDLSSIPKTVNNDACFDYIDRMPACKITTGALPVELSYECQNFIINKINYRSCVDIHKYDMDFYQKDWRIYLKRSSRIWKDRRENIVLYDNEGKIVDSLTY